MHTHARRPTLIASLALLCACASFAAPLSKADYQQTKDQISADYKQDKAACSNNSGNAKDICQERAKGKEKVAYAQAEFDYSGTAKDASKILVARADANFAVAKEICDDKAGNRRDVCRAEAKAAHIRAIADTDLADKRSEAIKEASTDKRKADYQVAAEKCDSLAGEMKTNCIRTAKVQFKQD